MMNKKTEQNQNFFPWMPYIFGIIFLIALAGVFFLFVNKNAEAADEQVIANPQEVITPVRDFLEGIKSDRVKDSYAQTSSDFKISMSFESFQGFTNQYDALTKWSSVTFSEPKFEKNVASVVAYLHAEEGVPPIPISFTLIREDRGFKIYGFILNSAEEEMPIKDINTLKDLIHAVNQDLSYLKKGNLMSAYYKLSTKNFQKNTPYEAFERYVKEHPFFTKQEGATFVDGSIKGKEGTLRVALYSEDESIPIDFSLFKEDNIWKIEKIDILAPSNLQKPLEHAEINQLMDVIQIFLQTLHEGLTEKAYNLFTSEGFKKSTSYTVFETFVKDHPLLTSEGDAQFIDGGKENNERIVYLLYGKTPYQSAFELKLAQEAGGWKIKGMSLESPQEETYAKQLDKEEALDLIQSLLATVHNEQYERFYRNYTSRSFTKATSYEEFLQFIDKHPVLKDMPKPVILEMMQDRDQIFIESELMDHDQNYSALFVYVFENDAWKIFRIEVKAENRASPKDAISSINLSQIIIGQKIDDLGMIQDSKQKFTNRDDPIFLNVFLTSPVPDAEIEVHLSHEETNTRTLPIGGKIDNEGNNILTFTFIPPANGWPEGNYKATAATSPDGEQILTYPFQFE